MVGISIFAIILTYVTFGIFHVFKKLGNISCPASVASEPLFDTYDEKCNESIRPASSNNIVSEITKKGYLFFVTIENTVTGEKQTLSNRNKKYLIWDANDIAYKFYNKEREIIQAAQNDKDGACMVQEESCMTKEEILSGFDNALHELKSYREGKLELKPLEDVLNEQLS